MSEEKEPRSEELIGMIEGGMGKERLREVLSQEMPADIAEALGHLEETEKKAVLDALDDEMAGEVLMEADEITRAEVVEMLGAERLAGVVKQLEPDDGADFLAELPEEIRVRVLEKVPAEETRELRQLLRYPEETGGGLMTPELVAVRQDMTAGQAAKALKQLEEPESIFFVHVVDANQKLIGSVPLGRLITADPERRIGELVDPEVVAIRADADQEEIARTFSQYNLTVAPVVDEGGKLLGRITVDDVIDVIEEEATEDAYKLAGSDDEELSQRSSWSVAKIRLQWLLICLMGALGSAAVIYSFELTLKDFFALTIFIPVITATGGNAGLQTSTITVRGLATGRLERHYLLPAVLKEIRVGGIIAATCAVFIMIVATIWSGEMTIGLAIGAAMFCAIIAAATLGVVVPVSLERMGKDPAIASGPVITTSNDAIGLLIYLGLASLLLQALR